MKKYIIVIPSTIFIMGFITAFNGNWLLGKNEIVKANLNFGFAFLLFLIGAIITIKIQAKKGSSRR